MNKRLRKKKRVGEFKELGVNVHIGLYDWMDTNVFIDHFLENIIEANNCYFGGGGSGPINTISGFIELGKLKDGPIRKLQKIIRALNNSPDVHTFDFESITDAWYGPFYEILKG